MKKTVAKKIKTGRLFKATFFQLVIIMSIASVVIEIFKILLLTSCYIEEIDNVQNEIYIAVNGMLKLYIFIHNSLTIMLYTALNFFIINYFVCKKIKVITAAKFYIFFKKSAKYLFFVPIIVFLVQASISAESIKLVIFVALNLYIIKIILLSMK